MLIVTTDCWMKTNGVNILGSHHWHCVCESSLGSETLWIHAGSQGAILDQSIWQFGRVHSGSCCSPYTPLLSAQHRAGQSRNRPTPVRLKQWTWRWYSVWWGHQRVSDENAQGLSPLISSLVLPQLSMQLCWWETHKIQSTQTHRAEIQLIDISQQPLYLIACLPLLLFHSRPLAETQPGYNDTNCRVWREAAILEAWRQGWLA